MVLESAGYIMPSSLRKQDFDPRLQVLEYWLLQCYQIMGSFTFKQHNVIVVSSFATVILVPNIVSQYSSFFYSLSSKVTQIASHSGNKQQTCVILGNYWSSVFPKTFLEMLCQPTFYIRGSTLLMGDNKRFCCFKCPSDWAEGLTGNVKGWRHCFKAGSIEIQ